MRTTQNGAATGAAESAPHAAKEALHVHDVFVRTLLHDLKAPLASLVWQVQVLRRRVDGGQLDPAALHASLEAIAAGAAQAVAAIDQLQDQTRADAAAPVPLRFERVDLVGLTRGIANAHPDSARAPLEIETGEAELLVNADPVRLARVVHNLLDNAVKYSQAHVPVTLSIGRELVDARAWATLRVRDSGTGIPAADLPASSSPTIAAEMRSQLQERVWDWPACAS
jgi:signal transduction histidine kinase